MSYKTDERGVGQHHAIITLAITGMVAVGERTFCWTGITNEEDAAKATLFARWALGSQLDRLLRANPRCAVATQTGGAWVTVVTWRENDLPPVTVTLPSFTSISEAGEAAKKAVKAFIKTLVPAGDHEARRELAAQHPVYPPDWLQEVFNHAKRTP